MRKTKMLAVIVMMMIALGACKKDKGSDKKEEGEGQLVYDGNKYSIKKGLIWDYGDMIYSTHYSQSYFLKNGSEFASWGEHSLGPDDAPITLFYMLSSPGTAQFKNGTFKAYYNVNYADWQINGLPDNMKNEYLLTSGYVGYDANGDRKISTNETFNVVGGTLTVTDSYTEYNLELENGKKVTGRNTAALTKTLPPV